MVRAGRSGSGRGKTMHWGTVLVFFRALLSLTPVWVDKGHGRWVRRIRIHPALRTFLGVALMALGIAWGMNVFMGPPVPETPRGPLPEATESVSPTLPAEPSDPQPLITDQNQPAAEPVKAENDVGTERPSLLKEQPDPRPRVLPRSLTKQDSVRPGDYWVRIRKGDYTLSLYRGDELVKNYSVAVGRNPGDKRRAGDHRTPVGQFRVQSIENSQRWKHDFGDGNGMIDGAYGPWFIRLDTGWKGIGIHGTHDPDSRGSMATEGCIRMSNEEVQELKRYAYKNMRVVIEE